MWRGNACGFSLGTLERCLLHPKIEAAQVGAAWRPPGRLAGPRMCVSTSSWRPPALAQAAGAMPRFLLPGSHLPPKPECPHLQRDIAGPSGRAAARLTGGPCSPRVRLGPVLVVTRPQARVRGRGGPAGWSCVRPSHADVAAGFLVVKLRGGGLGGGRSWAVGSPKGCYSLRTAGSPSAAVVAATSRAQPQPRVHCWEVPRTCTPTPSSGARPRQMKSGQGSSYRC